jgi:hypothetical protein
VCRGKLHPFALGKPDNSPHESPRVHFRAPLTSRKSQVRALHRPSQSGGAYAARASSTGEAGFVISSARRPFEVEVEYCPTRWSTLPSAKRR